MGLCNYFFILYPLSGKSFDATTAKPVVLVGPLEKSPNQLLEMDLKSCFVIFSLENFLDPSFLGLFQGFIFEFCPFLIYWKESCFVKSQPLTPESGSFWEWWSLTHTNPRWYLNRSSLLNVFIPLSSTCAGFLQRNEALGRKPFRLLSNSPCQKFLGLKTARAPFSEIYNWLDYCVLGIPPRRD